MSKAGSLQLTQAERLLAKLLACYDYRLPEEKEVIIKRLKYSKKTVEDMIRRLKSNQYSLWAQHIRDLRAIGLATLVAETRRRLEDAAAKKIEEIKIADLEKAGLPWARYFYSYREFIDGRAVYSYLAPLSLIDKITSDVEEYFSDGRVEVGATIPVRFDCTSLDPEVRLSDDVIDSAAREIERPPPSINYDLLEIVVYARLDMEPLAGIRDMQNIEWLVEERLGVPAGLRLRLRRLQQAHRRLSRLKLVGRALSPAAAWNRAGLVPFYIEVASDCAPRLYAVARGLWASPSIFVGSETAAAVMAVPDSQTPQVAQLLHGCVRRHGLITKGAGSVLPVEMYLPGQGWAEKPQPLLKLLWGRGLAERIKQQ
jgi:hypothetical protein